MSNHKKLEQNARILKGISSNNLTGMQKKLGHLGIFWLVNYNSCIKDQGNLLTKI
jgi:hypothetical protein